MRLRTRYTQRLPTAPGLRLDIPFFEGSGTKVLDLSGKGNHGTITDALWTRDENGVAMRFNGTSAYINCGKDASLNPTDAITIEVWMNRTDDGKSQFFVAKDEYVGTTKKGYNLFGTSTTLYWRIGDGTTARTIHTLYSSYFGKWTHIVGTWNGTTQRLYFNSIEVGTSVNWTGTIDYTADKDTFIGKQDIYQFNGIIDGVRIYAVALTAEQIKRRYEQTKRDYVRAS